MIEIQFKCTLLSDIILSQKYATKVQHSSLDYIPGNNFLGICAASLYDEADEDTFKIFHSGKVRFGDAHPSIKGIRGLRIPASFYLPKLKNGNERYFISHLTDFSMIPYQTRQCRDGFYSFADGQATKIPTCKGFILKSGHDYESRRSADGKMFTYEYLERGTDMYFSIFMDDDVAYLKNRVIDSICGTRHIGRSRMAEFGEVSISLEQFNGQDDTVTPQETNGERHIVVYADSRLIFMDENGVPTFMPKASDLGIADDPEAVIDWSASQVRTFQYAPWNAKRQAFDCDRCGLEKGSVLIVKTKSDASGIQFVGAYQNEGFGKIIINPAFIHSPAGDGMSGLTICKDHYSRAVDAAANAHGADTLLIRALATMSKKDITNEETLQAVEHFRYNNTKKFSASFASQWGSIRSIAMCTRDSQKLYDAVVSFITHGVSKHKWSERKRADKLIEFMENNWDNLHKALINLACEMQKDSNKDKNN